MTPEELRRRMKVKRRKRQEVDAGPPEPAPPKKRKARKKVFKKGAKRRGYGDAEDGEELQGGERAHGDRDRQGEGHQKEVLAVPEDERSEGAEDSEGRSVGRVPQRMRARKARQALQSVGAKRRGEKARGWYQCRALHISSVGFGWRKSPTCRECGGATTSLTYGELEDGQHRIVKL